MRARNVLLAMSLVIIGLAVLLAIAPHGEAAEQFTLNCVGAWPRGLPNLDFFVKDFVEGLQKKADEKFPGELKVIYRGGPEIVTANDQITAVSKGMFDLANNSVTYYVSRMPEMDAWNLTPMMPWEEKAVGLYDYIDQLHREKTNTHFLAHNGLGLKYYIMTKKVVKSLDELKGMSIRTNPTTLQVIKAIGANPVQMALPDVYTALERNVVQGMVMPYTSVRAGGYQKVTKCAVNSGFFDVNNCIIVNLDKWKKLPKHLQDLITEHADVHTRNIIDFMKDYEKNEVAAMKAEGIQFVDLAQPDVDRLQKAAREAIINIINEKAPVEGKKILEYFQKKP